MCCRLGLPARSFKVSFILGVFCRLDEDYQNVGSMAPMVELPQPPPLRHCYYVGCGALKKLGGHLPGLT